MRTLLRVEHLGKSLGGRSILEDITFDLDAGEACAILGPSGVGKTTLLKCLNLLLRPDAGAMSLAGEPVFFVEEQSSVLHTCLSPDRLRARIGMVFQEWNLWPNRTVLDNVAEGPRFVLRKAKSEAREIAARWCALVGLEDKLEAYPWHLSGGQKQRAAIARALALEPEILMFDEVTSALDPSRVAGILDLIRQLKEGRRALLVVTHHVQFAKALADRVLFLLDGRIHESGPPDEVLAGPATPELAEFLAGLERTH